ncbi:MAG: SH3 domain-containing protein [Planctomycetota bacterium]
MRPLCLLLTLSLVVAPARGQVADAQREYAAGRYEAARRAWAGALADPAVDAVALLLAMGNCSIRLGRHADAVLDYRRALLRDPSDTAALDGLALAEARLGRDPARPSLLSAWDGDGALGWSVLLQAVGFGAAVVLRRRRGACWSGLVVGLLGFAVAARLTLVAFLPAPATGVVLQPEVQLRSDPGSDGPVLARLHAGEVVEVVERSGPDLRIRAVGLEGWTATNGVGLVD